jgi:hypothetical protein
MDECIHMHSARVRRGGIEYEVHVYGAARADGTWAGRLEFHPLSGNGAVLRTGQETSQPSRRALDYWAGGLQPIYLDGALARASRNTSPPDNHGPSPRP